MSRSETEIAVDVMDEARDQLMRALSDAVTSGIDLRSLADHLDNFIAARVLLMILSPDDFDPSKDL